MARLYSIARFLAAEDWVKKTLKRGVSQRAFEVTAGGVRNLRSTEGAGEGAILEASDADVVNTSDGALAGHAGGHLDGNGEIRGGDGGEAADGETGNILGDLG